MAPAGSFESLHAAINAGCDSVYFGIADFNMRASSAVNFTFENLPEVVELCTKKGIKTYITVNTIMYNDDLNMMKKAVDAVKKAGATAVICADMATILYAKEKGVSVNISTQLSISNTQSLKFYSQYADVVVLARELTLEQIKKICIDIKEQDIRGVNGELIKVEIFAHGALCVSVSGRCYMSLYSTNTSANKGKCSQVCRHTFDVKDNQTGNKLTIDNNYVMSASDLCTIGMLDEIVESGVSILKFEGRGRSPEYVDTVIRTYKEALEAIKEDTYDEEKIEKWNKDLKTVFNRGLHEGFFRGKKFHEWSGVHGSKATEVKNEIGVVEKYYPKINVAQVLVKAKDTVKEGMKYSITGKTTGVVRGVFNNMKIDERDMKEVKQGDVVTFKIKEKVREGDMVYVLKKI